MKEYITSNEDRVVITIEEYVDLIRDSQTLEALLQALFDNAELSWDKKDLRFDDTSTRHVLIALCRNKYYGKLISLKMLEAKEEKKDDGTNKDL